MVGKFVLSAYAAGGQPNPGVDELTPNHYIISAFFPEDHVAQPPPSSLYEAKGLRQRSRQRVHFYRRPHAGDAGQLDGDKQIGRKASESAKGVKLKERNVGLEGNSSRTSSHFGVA